ncbi:SH3 domain-containing protein [Tenacibaculum sp. MAR_2010_89]|uniref:SH3 domain-containing protein n=1 Tax=Tenacibaculum sp. MAR_2010_89 TaxID=1250198 RepID=UPI000896AEAF|nr:SH3 domain-containing protein [Tenacibaculum sp. MAR_2010_89]SEE66760.1 SH3 domain-containing protein [Tenacibaculum sp. MAR_2010_89]
MKILVKIYMLFMFSNVLAQEYYFINAENGLNVRSKSNSSSLKIAKIPFGVVVEKLFDTNKKITINDNGKPIEGSWIKIKYNNYIYLVSKEEKPFEKEGYVFDGYLKKVKNKNVINTSKISLTKFNVLKEKIEEIIHRPKKNGNLDSIKKILKNRVTWVTKFENENYKREDAIKSIKTQNGQKLILNQHSNDYGFSEGWSGYYPAYNILVLEGGHSSDKCFSIKTGETELTIGNPKYIISSPKNTYRLNGYFGGQECISYFFQKKVNGAFIYLSY